MEKLQRNSGQVGIIMLLITVVMLTVGISAVSRTTSDVNISSTNEQSNRALDAAESDLEKALSGDLNAAQSGTTTSTSADGTLTLQTNVAKLRVLETSVNQGYTVGVDLYGDGSAPNGTTPVDISWAKETACAARASLVVTVLSTDVNNPIRRFYVGPIGPCARSGDNFNNPTAPVAGTSPYAYRFRITPAANERLIRIRPLYNGTDVQVTGASLPTQSYTVTSTAQNLTSKETKAVQVNRTIPVAPSILDYVLFSATSITQ